MKKKSVLVKKVALCFLICFIAVHISVVQAFASEITGYAVGTINVRKSPNGTLLGQLQKGQSVFGQLDGDWVQFTFNDQVAYVLESLLQSSPIAYSGYASTTVNVRCV